MRVLWLILFLVLGIGCTQDTTKDSEVSLSIKDVKAKHAARVMELPGVVSVGIGKGADGNPAIMIGIERESDEVRASLPKELDGFPVEVQVIGPIKAQ